MISPEEFEALKKRVDSLEALVNRLALSHKDVLEKYLPDTVNGLNRLTNSVATSQKELSNTLGDVMTGVGMLAKAVERIQNELEIPLSLP